MYIQVLSTQQTCVVQVGCIVPSYDMYAPNVFT